MTTKYGQFLLNCTSYILVEELVYPELVLEACVIKLPSQWTLGENSLFMSVYWACVGLKPKASWERTQQWAKDYNSNLSIKTEPPAPALWPPVPSSLEPKKGSPNNLGPWVFTHVAAVILDGILPSDLHYHFTFESSEEISLLLCNLCQPLFQVIEEKLRPWKHLTQTLKPSTTELFKKAQELCLLIL